MEVEHWQPKLTSAVGLAVKGILYLGLKCIRSSPVNCFKNPSSTRSNSPISDAKLTSFPNVVSRPWGAANNSRGTLLTFSSPNSFVKIPVITPLPFAPAPLKEEEFLQTHIVSEAVSKYFLQELSTIWIRQNLFQKLYPPRALCCVVIGIGQHHLRNKCRVMGQESFTG